MSHRRAHTKISVNIQVIGEVKTSTLKSKYERSDNVQVRRIVPETSRWADPSLAHDSSGECCRACPEADSTDVEAMIAGSLLSSLTDAK